MIEPLPAARMIGLACLMARNGPIRLMRSTSIQKAASRSGMRLGAAADPGVGVDGVQAAVLAHRHVDQRLDVGLVAGVAGHRQGRRRPRRRSSPRSRAPSSARSKQTTLAPSWANRRAVARPMPLAAPVMTVDRPASRPALVSAISWPPRGPWRRSGSAAAAGAPGSRTCPSSPAAPARGWSRWSSPPACSRSGSAAAGCRG